jgi:hypothetical protein
MRKTLLLLGLAVIFLFGAANAQDSVYFTADSAVDVIGDVLYMHPLGGGDVAIGVNAYNAIPIAALVYPLVETKGVADLPLALNNGGATPICFGWQTYGGGPGRVAAIPWGVMAFNRNLYPQFLLGATAMMAAALPIGDGNIATLRFTMPGGAADTAICLDSAFYPPSSVLTHVDTLAVGYTPALTTKLCFPVVRRPNTPPDIDCDASVSGFTEASVDIDVSATDPEGDAISPTINAWTDAGCGSVGYTGTNPWVITFTTTGCVAGTYNMFVEVCDEFGACDTCVTEVTLESFFIVATINEIDCVFPGGVVEIPVTIFSGVDIGGFKFYIEYDPTVMMFLGVERGDLIDDFDGYYDEYNHTKRYFFQYFETRMLPCYQQCETYKIKVVGIADMPDNWITGPLVAGEGELLVLRFKVARDANLQDLFLPVIWEFDYDFDLKAPSFSSAGGESLYVDQNWPGELTGPNYDIFPIVTFENGGVKICSDAYCWTGDLNLNEYAYEIADAVLYANYFIYGPEVFDIDYDLQILASDVNKDGFYPSIADFVFLVRIILEDISPKHKLAPTSELANVTVVTQGDAVKVVSNSNTSIGAALYVFKHSGEVANMTSLSDMNVKYSDANGELRVLVYSFEGKSISGVTDLFSFEAKGVELVEVNAADFYGSAMKSTITTKVLPTKFALMNNYPNPFNLNTNISFAVPVDAKVSLKLYNVAGQLVKSYGGVYEAGNHTITWDGTNTKGATVASGIYFYKLVAGDYSCTKKMVLTK